MCGGKEASGTAGHGSALFHREDPVSRRWRSRPFDREPDVVDHARQPQLRRKVRRPVLAKEARPLELDAGPERKPNAEHAELACELGRP
jgi:hypothetical protein